MNNVLRIKHFLFPIFIILYSLFYIPTHAEPNCESPTPGDVDYCLQRIEGEINALKPAHEYNKKELEGLKRQVDSLGKKISGILNQLTLTEKDIKGREEDLAYAGE